jgi:uncharacterized protein (TIGR02145 family)
MKTKTRVLIILIIFIGLTILFNVSCKKSDDDSNNSTANEVTDVDGNVYHTVTIGTQVWMVENLKTTKYNDGTSIPYVTEELSWVNLTTPAYCYYDNIEGYKSSYGALYNQYVIMTGKLCPPGWHVPSYTEWNTLMYYLGGSNVAGGKLKEAGASHWLDPNTAATNETGFTAFAGGARNIYISPEDNREAPFEGLNEFASFWGTYNESTQKFANVGLYNDTGEMDLYETDYIEYLKRGASVRCIKD